MSGYKRATVSISQDEYDRLREAETKFQTIPALKQETQKKIQETSLQLLSQSVDDMQEREERYRRILEGMDGYVQQVESQASRKMVALERQILSKVQTSVGSLSEHYEDILAFQTNVFNSKLAELEQKSQSQIDAYLQTINVYEESRYRKRTIAETWEKMALDLFFFLKNEYPHDFFFPGALNKIEFRLNQAADNCQNELFETAIDQFQCIYTDLSNTKLDLDQSIQRWKILFQAVYEATQQLLASQEKCNEIQAIDLDGEALPFLVDVDQWTNGRLRDWQDRLHQFCDIMLNQMKSPSEDMLFQALQEDIPRFNDELSDIVFDARIRSLNSQLRINIADLVVQALSEQGFRLEDANYEANDMRLNYDACLKNIEGNEVIVKVCPTGNQIGENELHLESLDAELKTEHELNRRWMEINASLQNVGISIGPYEIANPPAPINRYIRSIPGQRNRSIQHQVENIL